MFKRTGLVGVVVLLLTVAVLVGLGWLTTLVN